MSLASFIRFLLLSLPLFLPFAQAKFVFFGVPLYLIELPILLATLLFFGGIFSHQLKWKKLSSLEIGAGLAASLFFLGAILSFLHNPFSLTGLGMLKTWFLFPLLFVFLVIQIGWKEKDRETLFLLWLCSTGVVALGSLPFLLTGELTYDGRLAGWYASPNYLAATLVPGILIALFFLWNQRKNASLSWKYLVYSTLLVVFLVVLFATHSYGTWGALAVSALFLVFSLWRAQNQRKMKWALPGALVVIGILTFISLESGNEKWKTLWSLEERSSLHSRIMIWESARKMIADEPFFGIGLGRFQAMYLEYQKYFPPYLEWAVPEPHNLYLAVWLSTGLVGLFGFFGLLYLALKHLWKNIRKRGEGQEEMQSALLALSLLLFYLLYGLIDTPYFKTDLAFSFWFLIALALSYKKNSPTGA